MISVGNFEIHCMYYVLLGLSIPGCGSGCSRSVGSVSLATMKFTHNFLKKLHNFFKTRNVESTNFTRYRKRGMNDFL